MSLTVEVQLMAEAFFQQQFKRLELPKDIYSFDIYYFPHTQEWGIYCGKYNIMIEENRFHWRMIRVRTWQLARKIKKELANESK